MNPIKDPSLKQGNPYEHEEKVRMDTQQVHMEKGLKR